MSGFDPDTLWQQLEILLKQCQQEKSPCLTIAFSGGLDSTVLLHSLHGLQQTKSFQLRAAHINHQLQSASDAWAIWCEDFCKQRNITFFSTTVDAHPKANEGPEAAARHARYEALSAQLNENDLLLTAHHLDDQVETTLLQMLRGTGVTGVSGMQTISKMQSMTIVRPLLRFTRQQLKNYAVKHQLEWIDDPSNASDSYDRNYLRLTVLPAIAQRWPAYLQTISRFANNAGEASEILGDVAENDLLKTCSDDQKSVDINVLTQLSEARQVNLLRFWIKLNEFRPPNRKHLFQIMQMLSARQDNQAQVNWSNAEVRRYRNRLYIMPRTAAGQMHNLPWDGKQALKIPGLGELQVKPALGTGLKKSCLAEKLEIRFRQGGEHCRPAGRKETHSLKKLFQDFDIPPWQRERIPLLYVNDQLAAVIGLFYCEGYAAEKDEVSIELYVEQS